MKKSVYILLLLTMEIIHAQVHLSDDLKTILENLDPKQLHKEEQKNIHISQANTIYNLAFQIQDIKSIYKKCSSELGSFELHRLHILPSEGTKVLITIYSDEEESWIEIHGLNINPDLLFSLATRGGNWKEYFATGRLFVVEKKRNLRELFRMFKKMDLFSFPSSNQVYGRSIVIHPDEYIHESIRNGHYHRISYSEPDYSEDNPFDSLFLELIARYRKLLPLGQKN